MAKGSAQKHLHSRISFLHQAANYLATVENDPRTDVRGDVAKLQDGVREHSNVAKTEAFNTTDGDMRAQEKRNGEKPSVAKTAGLSRRYICHLKALSRKAVIRLTPQMKHSVCRSCDIPLQPGTTSTIVLENRSRNGRRSHADVLVLTCNACGTARRFPVGAQRQQRRKDRQVQTRGETA